MKRLLLAIPAQGVARPSSMRIHIVLALPKKIVSLSEGVASVGGPFIFGAGH